jgi:hypothetical protein
MSVAAFMRWTGLIGDLYRRNDNASGDAVLVSSP